MGLGFRGGTYDSTSINGAVVYKAIQSTHDSELLAQPIGDEVRDVDLVISDMDCVAHLVPAVQIFTSGNALVSNLFSLLRRGLEGNPRSIIADDGLRLRAKHVVVTMDSRAANVSHRRREISKKRRETSKFTPITDEFIIRDDFIRVGDSAGVTMGSILVTSGPARVCYNNYIAGALIRYADTLNFHARLTVVHNGTIHSNHPEMLAALATIGPPGSCLAPTSSPAVAYVEGDLILRQMMLYMYETKMLAASAQVVLSPNADTDTLMTACLPNLPIHIWWVRSHKAGTPYRCLNLNRLTGMMLTAINRHNVGTSYTTEQAMVTFYFWMLAVFGGDYVERIRGPVMGRGLELLATGKFEPCVNYNTETNAIEINLRGVHSFLRAWIDEAASDIALPSFAKKIAFLPTLPAILTLLAHNVMYYMYGVEYPGDWGTAPRTVPWNASLGRRSGDGLWKNTDLVWTVTAVPDQRVRSAMDVYCCWERATSTDQTVHVEFRAPLSVTEDMMDGLIDEAVLSNWIPPNVTENEPAVIALGDTSGTLKMIHPVPPDYPLENAVARLMITPDTVEIIPHVYTRPPDKAGSPVRRSKQLPQLAYNRYAHPPPYDPSTPMPMLTRQPTVRPRAALLLADTILHLHEGTHDQSDLDPPAKRHQAESAAWNEFDEGELIE